MPGELRGQCGHHLPDRAPSGDGDTDDGGVRVVGEHLLGVEGGEHPAGEVERVPVRAGQQFPDGRVLGREPAPGVQGAQRGARGRCGVSVRHRTPPR